MPILWGEVELFMDNYQKYGAECPKCSLYIGIELECGTEPIDGWKAVRIKRGNNTTLEPSC